MSDFKINSEVLPQASSENIGGIKIGYAENNKNYPVQLEDGKAFVNVPWVGSGGIQSITYAELKQLRDNNSLIPGQQYRIIDYEATTTQEGTMAYNEQLFDIIVTADGLNRINPNARAAIGTTQSSQFADIQKYEDWELKYDIDNGYDTTRDYVGTCKYWGDPEGKGLIYYLKDEYGNACGFDFKNIVIDAYYAQGQSLASSKLNDMVFTFNAPIRNIESEENYSYIFPFPDIDTVYDSTILPQCIRNAKISNYIPQEERVSGDTWYEYIPYVIVFPNYQTLPYLNLNIENSDRIFITQDTSSNLDSIIGNISEVNINIKNSVDIILCDVHSKNANIINSGHENGVCIMGVSYAADTYDSGGFVGQELLLNNVGTCMMELCLIFADPEISLRQIIKINNCNRCIFTDCEPTNNFICDNVFGFSYSNTLMNNHNNIVIKNSPVVLPISPTSCGLTEHDEQRFDHIITYDADNPNNIAFYNTKDILNLINS